MSVSATEIAMIGQYAENIYFGKPCGLMDQMACASGGLVHIDFRNPSKPVTETIDFDLERFGYSLCITDTKGSHADLTDEYATVPLEMKRVANYFCKEVLVDITMEDVLSNMVEMRKVLSDRCEMDLLASAIIEGKDIRAIAEISKHADWVGEWKDDYEISSENIKSILQKEIGTVFVKVLECAGVYKRTEKGAVGNDDIIYQLVEYVLKKTKCQEINFLTFCFF